MIILTTKIQKKRLIQRKSVNLQKDFVNMIRVRIYLSLFFILTGLYLKAQTYPSAQPKMVIETENGESDETSYSGSAPIVAHFTSNPTNLGNYTPLYEWHVYKAGEEESPYLVRYTQDFDYTFLQAGTSYISLNITFVLGTDSIEYELEEPFSVVASESVLNVPNAFSPNGDGRNDIFRVKPDYKSIIEFHGYIFNRWGKKIFEWTDISKGWDGKYNGSNVADGVYYCRIDAKGADGKTYKIRKAVNLLRGYLDESSTRTSN